MREGSLDLHVLPPLPPRFWKHWVSRKMQPQLLLTCLNWTDGWLMGSSRIQRTGVEQILSGGAASMRQAFAPPGFNAPGPPGPGGSGLHERRRGLARPPFYGRNWKRRSDLMDVPCPRRQANDAMR